MRSSLKIAEAWSITNPQVTSHETTNRPNRPLFTCHFFSPRLSVIKVPLHLQRVFLDFFRWTIVMHANRYKNGTLAPNYNSLGFDKSKVDITSWSRWVVARIATQLLRRFTELKTIQRLETVVNIREKQLAAIQESIQILSAKWGHDQRWTCCW